MITNHHLQKETTDKIQAVIETIDTESIILRDLGNEVEERIKDLEESLATTYISDEDGILNKDFEVTLLQNTLIHYSSRS